MKELKGIIKKPASISAAVLQPQNITAAVHQSNSRPDVEKYSGPYEATPTKAAQIMPTKDKLLKEDFTVKAIPFFEVTNAANGKTITIGG